MHYSQSGMASLRRGRCNWGLTDVSRYATIWYQNPSDRDTSKSQGQRWEWAWRVLETERRMEGSEGKRWCQRGGNELHNTSQARSLDVILRTRKSHLRALHKEKRQKLVCLFKRPPWLPSEEELQRVRDGIRRPVGRLGLGCQLRRGREQTREQEGLGNVLSGGSEEKGRTEEDSNPRTVPLIHVRNWVPFYREREVRRRDWGVTWLLSTVCRPLFNHCICINDEAGIVTIFILIL